MPARVLVVDDILPNVKVLEAKLAAEYFEVATAMSGKEALASISASPPDLVLLDVMMPDMDGYEVCHRIKANPALSTIPVVMVTALSNAADRVRGLDAGAEDFLTKPVNDLALFARVRSLVRLKLMMDELRLREETSSQLGVLDPATVTEGKGLTRALVIDDGQIDCEVIKEALTDLAEVTMETDGDRGMQKAIEGDFDLILVSLHLRSADGLRLASHLRATAQTRNASIVAIVRPGDTAQLVRALEMGVSDYIATPIDRYELSARARTQIRRKRYQDRLRTSYQMSVAMAVTDPLTGLHNRRYFVGHMDNLVGRANAGGRPVSVMMLDIDHFKRVNDTYRHAAGDEVLREFANRLRRGLRGIDLPGRYGGEEFAVAMPDTDRETAQMVAERLRRFIAEEPFAVSGGHSLPITASIGVASSTGDNDTSGAMLDRADKALYAAKEGGRNRVVVETVGAPVSA